MWRADGGEVPGLYEPPVHPTGTLWRGKHLLHPLELPRSPSRPSCRVDSNKSALGLFAYHTGRRFRHPYDRVAGGIRRSLRVPNGTPKLGRLLCGSYSEVLVPLGGITLPIHLEGGHLAFFDCAIGPCQGRGALPAVSSVLFRISVKFSVKAPDVQSLAAVLVSNRP